MNGDPKNQTDIDKRIILCLECGFPNRIGDTRCMFCRTPLEKKINFISRLEYFFIRIKLKVHQAKKMFKYRKQKRSKFITLMVGVLLFLSGSYMFTNALFTNNFTYWMISILFLIYGIFSINFFIHNKQKSL